MSQNFFEPKKIMLIFRLFFMIRQFSKSCPLHPPNFHKTKKKELNFLDPRFKHRASGDMMTILPRRKIHPHVQYNFQNVAVKQKPKFWTFNVCIQFFRVEFCSLKFDRNDLGNPEKLPCRNYRCLKNLSNFDCPYGKSLSST